MDYLFYLVLCFSCFLYSIQTKKLSPSEIFHTHIADLSKPVASNLEDITDSLFSERLIGQDLLQSTTTEDVSKDQKAIKVVYELFNILPVEKFFSHMHIT